MMKLALVTAIVPPLVGSSLFKQQQHIKTEEGRETTELIFR